MVTTITWVLGRRDAYKRIADELALVAGGRKQPVSHTIVEWARRGRSALRGAALCVRQTGRGGKLPALLPPDLLLQHWVGVWWRGERDVKARRKSVSQSVNQSVSQSVIQNFSFSNNIDEQFVDRASGIARAATHAVYRYFYVVYDPR